VSVSKQHGHVQHYFTVPVGKLDRDVGLLRLDHLPIRTAKHG
jgi:hypothetical protein